MLGVDILGIAHPLFKIRDVLAVVPKDFAIGVLDCEDTFGRCFKQINKFLAEGYVTIRSHLHWSTSHQVTSLKKLKAKLPQYQKLALKYPHARIYVSHSLEYNEQSKDAIKKRIALVKELAPNCIPVNSVYIGATLPDVITEHHGDITVKKGEIISMDGVDVSEMNVRHWSSKNKQALIRFGWRSSFNLREPAVPAPPPLKRKRPPTRDEIAEVVRLLKG